MFGVPEITTIWDENYYAELGKEFIQKKEYEQMSEEEFEKFVKSLNDSIKWGDDFDIDDLDDVQIKLHNETVATFNEEKLSEILVQFLPPFKSYQLKKEPNNPNKWSLDVTFEKDTYQTSITQTGPNLSTFLSMSLSMIKNTPIELKLKNPLKLSIETKDDMIVVSFEDKSFVMYGLNVKSITYNKKLQTIKINELSVQPSVNDMLQIVPGITWN